MVLAELTTYLATKSIGVAGTNLFYGFMPPLPDNCVCLYGYGGLPGEPDMGSNPGVLRAEFPFVQAVARGAAEDTTGPMQKIRDVVDAFVAIIGVQLSGVMYQAVIPKQAPFLMRRDDEFRVYWACNFEVTKDY